jgi:hypothetical protein
VIITLSGAALSAGLLLAVPHLGLDVPRLLWPEVEISRRMQDIWVNETHTPLRIVGGEILAAGTVALTAHDAPSLYTSPDYPFVSPWITPDRIAREGYLVVWKDRGKGPPPVWRSRIADRQQGEEHFRWSTSARSPDLEIGYAIVPPSAKHP